AHAGAEARAERLHHRTEFEQLGVAHHAIAADHLQDRTLAIEKHAPREATLDLRPPFVQLGRRYAAGKLDDVINVLRRLHLGPRRWVRPHLYGRLAAAVEQHVGVGRSERFLGVAPRRAFLPTVVDDYGDDGHAADHGQTDLEIRQAASSSRMRSASSMSTATTFETPDS